MIQKIINKRAITILFCIIFSICQMISISAQSSDIITVTLDGKLIDFDVPPQSVNGRTMVPMRAIFEELGAKVTWIQETKEVIAEKGDKVIKLKVGSADAYINDKLIKLDAAPCSFGGRTLVPVRFIAESMGLIVDWDNENKRVIINTPENKAKDKVSIQSNGLPEFNNNYEIKIIHEQPLPYWEWDKKDMEYIEALGFNLDKSTRDKLIYEIFLLSKYGEVWQKQYVEVNNFKFYPTTVVGVIDTIGRAIKARYSLLFYEAAYGYEYPSPGKSGIINTEEWIFETIASKEMFEEFVNHDRLMLEILKGVPFSTEPYRGYRVLNAPFSIRSVMHACIAGGVARIGYEQILLSAYSGANLKDTFYHELGHTWSYIYLDDYAEYTALRGKPIVTDSNAWEELTAENFAEDFRFAKSPYSDKSSFKTSYGEPTEQEIGKIREWISKVEQSKAATINYTTINGEQPFWTTYATDNNKITFEGKCTNVNDFTIVIKMPDWTEKKIKVTPENSRFKFDITFDEEGLYTIQNVIGIGEVNVIYYKDFNNIKVEVENTQKEKEEKQSWEILKAQDVSSEVSYWILSNKEYPGIWTIERTDGLYVLVTNGKSLDSKWQPYYKKIKLKDVILKDDKTIIEVEVDKGDSEVILIKLPRKAINNQIDVIGLENELVEESAREDIFIIPSVEGKEIVSGGGLYFDIVARSKTGKIYMEMKNGEEIMYKDTILLKSSYPHFNRVEQWLTLTGFKPGKTDIIFYEDLNKKEEIGRTYIFIK